MKNLFKVPQVFITACIFIMLAASCSKPVSPDPVSPDQQEGEENIPGSLTGRSVTLLNPGFESDKANWGDPTLFAISTSDKHSGAKSAKLSSLGNRIQQAVTVSPNTDYTLTAWILGKGTIGAKSGSTVLNSKGGTYSNWTQVTVNFNSGSASSVTLYGAYNAGEGRFDDFALEEGSSGGGGGNLPADVLNLTNWKITLPFDGPDSGTTADEITQPALATYSIDPWFKNNANNTGVIFRANTGGATTSGSGYPRSELREMTNNGATNASWSSGSGTHTMEIDQAITHLPAVKKHIVAGQIHDAGDDVIVFRLENQKLFIDINGDDGPTLTSNYVLGTRFKVKFVVSNNQTKCYYNDVLVYTHNQSYSGAYFKAGAYTQSSCKSGGNPGPTESCDAYGEVVIYGLSVTHQ